MTLKIRREARRQLGEPKLAAVELVTDVAVAEMDRIHEEIKA